MSNIALAEKVKQDVTKMMQAHKDKIAETLPKETNIMALAQDLKFAITVSEQNPSAKVKLAECTPASLLACCVTAVNFGVSINPQHKEAYLIPYRMGNETIAQLNISYMGLVNQIYARTGIKMRAVCVYSNEPLEFYSDGFDQVFKHTELPPSKRGDFLCVVSIAKMPDGDTLYERMWAEDVEKCKNASPAGKKGFGPWFEWFDGMAKKSVLRRQSKSLPKMPTDIANMLRADEDLELGRPQILEKAYEEMGIKIEPPPQKSEDEVISDFDGIMTISNDSDKADEL